MATPQTSDNNELTVGFWNLLFDANEPSLVDSQSDRITDIIASLKQLSDNAIVGLAEVEGSNGQVIANALKSRSSYFIENDRPGSHVGVVSGLNVTIDKIELGGQCRGLIIKRQGITVIVVHLTLQLFSDMLGKQQLTTILSYIDANSPTIIMGDFNSMHWQGSRKLLHQAGFTSAFKRTALRRQPTAPTKKYRKILPTSLKILSLPGFSLDDIYVRGLEILASGTFEGESDHRGVWAKVLPPS